MPEPRRLTPIIIHTLADEVAAGYGMFIYCEDYDCRYKARASYPKWIALLGPDYAPSDHGGTLRGWRCPACGGWRHSLRIQQRARSSLKSSL